MHMSEGTFSDDAAPMFEAFFSVFKNADKVTQNYDSKPSQGI